MTQKFFLPIFQFLFLNSTGFGLLLVDFNLKDIFITILIYISLLLLWNIIKNLRYTCLSFKFKNNVGSEVANS
jgi:hypothetical protein